MSAWLHVDAWLDGVRGNPANEPTPQGSEGGSPLQVGGPGYYRWYTALRDRDAEDVPEIRDWFAQLCAKYAPTTAALMADDGCERYSFEWNSECQRLELEVPALYMEHLRAKGLSEVAEAAKAFSLTLECEAPEEHVTETSEGLYVVGSPCGECAPCTLEAALAKLEGS